MRFTKTEILAAFEREDKSYRLGMMCTHWIRDIERYTSNAADLAATLHMQAGDRWVSNNDLAALLADPTKRELLSSDFLLTYLHTLIRAFVALSAATAPDAKSPGRRIGRSNFERGVPLMRPSPHPEYTSDRTRQARRAD
jgi:hypothetical protein